MTFTLTGYFDLWARAQKTMEEFDSHYSVQPYQAREIFDQAVLVPEGGRIVELGVCNGRTSAMLCTVANEVNASYYGIDFFGLENDAKTIRAKLALAGLTGSIIEGNTHDVGRHWDPERLIDLIFIDAGHDEANVGPDCEIWIPLVKPGGVVVFHDYGDEVGAHQAVKSNADRSTEGWERISDANGMLIARRPDA